MLVLLEVLGLAALPLAARALGRLPGAGLGFAKVLGLLLVAWLVWLAGSLGVPNGSGLAIGAALVLALLGAAVWRLGRRAEADPFRRRLWIASEVVFALAFLGGTLYMALSPDVWGTEKPMDMMLVNATIVSDSYPPHDPWLSGEQLNYYYLGQLMAGLLIRLTAVEPSAGYNLAMAAVFALSATAAFALGSTLAEAARRQGLAIRRPLAAGASTVVLLLLIGNLRGGWAALTHSGGAGAFDWFAQSRVIPDTINEFPLFSFVVGDLHAHVIALPLTLLALAFTAQAALAGPPRLLRLRGWWETFCAALSIGILYAVNSWSWPVAAGLLAAAIAVWLRDPQARRRRGRAIAWGAAVVGGGIVLVLPFLLEFDPNARGIGVVGRRESLGAFAGHHAEMYGALAWILGGLYLARLIGARHPARVLVFGTTGGIVAVALLSAADLAGAALVVAAAGVALHAAFSRALPAAERVTWLLVAGGLACIAGPELLYVRDEFDETRFVRMNTIFKMGYQAWILLAVAGGVAVAVAPRRLPRLPRLLWAIGAAGLVAVSAAYAVTGSAARKAGIADVPRLDGRSWLARTSPGDIAAIDWLRDRARGEAVLLEAVGDDYSPFGNARMSTYTGRPTVLGWQGHELQWSHDVGSRRADVETMYRSGDAAVVRGLLERYRVEYAVLGPLERTTYGEGGALASLGRRVFERDGTAIYAYDPPPPRRERREPKRPPALGGS